jgi:hypothetical protein
MKVHLVAALVAESGRRHVVVVGAAFDSNLRQARRPFSKTRLQTLLGAGESMTIGTTPVARKNVTELRVSL